MNHPRKRFGTWSAGLAAITLATACLVQAASAADPETEPPKPGDSAEARQILSGMAKFLAAQKSFRVEIACSHDSVQPYGQKIEFLDKRELVVRRPNDLRMEVERSDGYRTEVVMNKDTITAQALDDQAWAQAPAKATLDDSIHSFVDDLHMQLPLALMLVSDFPAEIERRVVQADYVEETEILGKPMHHISGSTDTIEFQFWISADDKPLPYRVVLTYPDAAGEPQFRAMFSDWKLSPWISSSTFEAKIPKDSKRIAFLSQVRTAAARNTVAGAADSDKGAKR